MQRVHIGSGMAGAIGGRPQQHFSQISNPTQERAIWFATVKYWGPLGVNSLRLQDTGSLGGWRAHGPVIYTLGEEFGIRVGPFWSLSVMGTSKASLV